MLDITKDYLKYHQKADNQLRKLGKFLIASRTIPPKETFDGIERIATIAMKRTKEFVAIWKEEE